MKKLELLVYITLFFMVPFLGAFGLLGLVGEKYFTSYTEFTKQYPRIGSLIITSYFILQLVISCGMIHLANKG